MYNFFHDNLFIDYTFHSGKITFNWCLKLINAKFCKLNNNNGSNRSIEHDEV